MAWRTSRRLPLVVAGLLAGCAAAPVSRDVYVGTDEPFAANAVYFVVTDRFVNGDPANDHREQGGVNRTFDIPVSGPDGESDNIGYLGGDFKGLADHAGYIRDMGFGAVWLTPIVDNPDEAFTGGDPVRWGSFLTDRGKAGYHGYWGVNFYALDEHLPSPGMDFRALTAALRDNGLVTVLDIVANHGSPSYTMPTDQPKFGEIYDASGQLVADHQNLPPEQLDPRQPLHRFFHAERDLVQLSNFDDSSPVVLDYLVGAYLKWIDEGAGAFRIDTVRHMPPAFWQAFSNRIRERHPGFFLFGEVFDSKAEAIAAYTHPEGGAMSVLDFPLKDRLVEVFGKGRGFEILAPALHLEDAVYRNPYELMTFYDNHDMARLDATDEGFIDAHHWLFTARGIPVIYYGSEIGFMRGRPEHAGNRNYFGKARIAEAVRHPIQQQLSRIGAVRRELPALQKGLQVTLELAGDRAAFYRVYQQGGTAQIALVLLNKGDAAAAFRVSEALEPGQWRDVLGAATQQVDAGEALQATVPAHGVAVFVHDGPVTQPDLVARLRPLDRFRRNGG
ncbi:alpha-amylase family glycosyl hydrolase [Tahibacter amnicola]|uniref:Alpha-amylase n=1 Tax=Tahibacter amnicola TaxID=2976241 RepID=A0ABY6BEA6_9GAMM|nr:alpha-amylase family glycosyl hydrolase [Tahibacter amnicola]UXI68117.1 alpha-amylase family glycosyl hydrolase [Tahibacter amnicola]